MFFILIKKLFKKHLNNCLWLCKKQNKSNRLIDLKLKHGYLIRQKRESVAKMFFLSYYKFTSSTRFRLYKNFCGTTKGPLFPQRMKNQSSLTDTFKCVTVCANLTGN